MNIVTRKGAWVFYGTSKEDSKLTVQGVMNMYKTLKTERRDMFKEIKALIDGEDVEPKIEHDAEAEQLALNVAAAEAEDREENPEPTMEDINAAFEAQ